MEENINNKTCYNCVFCPDVECSFLECLIHDTTFHKNSLPSNCEYYLSVNKDVITVKQLNDAVGRQRKQKHVCSTCGGSACSSCGGEKMIKSLQSKIDNLMENLKTNDEDYGISNITVSEMVKGLTYEKNFNTNNCYDIAVARITRIGNKHIIVEHISLSPKTFKPDENEKDVITFNSKALNYLKERPKKNLLEFDYGEIIKISCELLMDQLFENRSNINKNIASWVHTSQSSKIPLISRNVPAASK